MEGMDGSVKFLEGIGLCLAGFDGPASAVFVVIGDGHLVSKKIIFLSLGLGPHTKKRLLWLVLWLSLEKEV